MAALKYRCKQKEKKYCIAASIIHPSIAKSGAEEFRAGYGLHMMMVSFADHIHPVKAA